MKPEIVIVGGGAAGLHAALGSRRCRPENPITLIAREEACGYYRALLPRFMAGQLGEERLFFWRPGEDPDLKFRSGARVASLDRAAQALYLESGEKLAYERLILAPGGAAMVPHLLKENPLGGIFPVRGLPAARATREWLRDKDEVAVLGGGLVGVKTAVYLRAARHKVSIIEKETHLLPRVLSPGAAKVVQEHLERAGLLIFCGGSLDEVRGAQGALESIRVGGAWVPARTLLVAIGSAPSLRFLEGSGLLEKGELFVSPSLQTADERIFAAGDAVTIRKASGEEFRPWTWPQAVGQGKLAAENLYRAAPQPLSDLHRPNAIDLHGLPLVVLGPPVAKAETVLSFGRGGSYREIFLRNGCPAGGALVGDIAGAGPLHAAMNWLAARPLPPGESLSLLQEPRSFLLRGLAR